MSIFLTGGTGFFGRSLLRHLGDKNKANKCVDRVAVLTRSPNFFLENNPEFSNCGWLTFIKGDIENPATFAALTQKFTHVIHMASDSTVESSADQAITYNQIAHGTRNLLEFARYNKIKNLLYISSGAVYGPQPRGMERVSEHYKIHPNSLKIINNYALSKLAAEKLCREYINDHGLNIKIARCFSFVGEDLPLNKHFAIGNFIRDAMYGKEIIINGNGSPIRSYLDQRDLAVWLMKILCYGGCGEIFNVGSDERISILDLAYKVKNIISPKLKVIMRNQILDSINRDIYVPDITKAKNNLGLSVKFTLDDAIKEAFSRLELGNFKC